MEQIRYQAARIGPFIKSTDNTNKLAKLIEAALGLCGAGNHPICRLSKTARGMLNLPRSYAKCIESVQGERKGPFIGERAHLLTRVIFMGLATLYSLNALTFLHEKGAIDLGDRLSTISTLSAWNGVFTGLIGVPLSLWSMGEISGRLDSDSLGAHSKEEWNTSWWIHCWTVGQVGCELLNGLLSLNGWNSVANLARFAALSSFLRGWVSIDPNKEKKGGS